MIAEFLLIVCQTFDAVDGKQARRTSSSSPLGELFDHGIYPLLGFYHTVDGVDDLTNLHLFQVAMPLHVQ